MSDGRPRSLGGAARNPAERATEGSDVEGRAWYDGSTEGGLGDVEKDAAAP